MGPALIVGGLANTWIATDVLIPAFGGRASYDWSYTALGNKVRRPRGTWPPIRSAPCTCSSRRRSPSTPCSGCSGRSASCRCCRRSRSPRSRCCFSAFSPTPRPTGGRRPSTTTPTWWSCWSAPPRTAPPGWTGGSREPGSSPQPGGRHRPAPPASHARHRGRGYRTRRVRHHRAGAAGTGNHPAGRHRRAGVRRRDLRARPVPDPPVRVRARAAPAVLPPERPHGSGGRGGRRGPERGHGRGRAVPRPAAVARDFVLLWDGDGGTPPTYAPWVVANIRQPQFSFPSVQDQKQRVAQLVHDGYQIVFRRHGYLVLHRAGPAGAQPPITQGTSNGS